MNIQSSTRESRPSDLHTVHSAHPTTRPTMRIREVKPAPGTRSRSQRDLLQRFQRAPTGGWTSSSLHPADSHVDCYADSKYPHMSGAPDGAVGGPPATVGALGADGPDGGPVLRNLQEQRDVLQAEVELLRGQSAGRLRPLLVNAPGGARSGAGLAAPRSAPYGAFCAAGPSGVSAGGMAAGPSAHGPMYGSATGAAMQGTESAYAATPAAGLGAGAAHQLSGRRRPASAAATAKLRELDAEKRAAEERADEADARTAAAAAELAALRHEMAALRDAAEQDRYRAADAVGRLDAALLGQRRAEELRVRASADLQHAQHSAATLGAEVGFLRAELDRCHEYMRRFGGIGKDFHNDFEGTAAPSDPDAAAYFSAAAAKICTGSDGTPDEILAVCNRVLQGPASAASEGVRGTDGSTEGPAPVSGKLGLVAQTNAMRCELASLKDALRVRDDQIDGLNDSLGRLSAESARVTMERRELERRLHDTMADHECDKVALADARGEVEYLRLLAGEQADAIARHLREHQRLHEGLQAANAACQEHTSGRQAADDYAAKLAADVAALESREADVRAQADAADGRCRSLSEALLAREAEAASVGAQLAAAQQRLHVFESGLEAQIAAIEQRLKGHAARMVLQAREEEDALRDALDLLGQARRDAGASGPPTGTVATPPPPPPGWLGTMVHQPLQLYQPHAPQPYPAPYPPSVVASTNVSLHAPTHPQAPYASNAYAPSQHDHTQGPVGPGPAPSRGGPSEVLDIYPPVVVQSPHFT